MTPLASFLEIHVRSAGLSPFAPEVGWCHPVKDFVEPVVVGLKKDVDHQPSWAGKYNDEEGIEVGGSRGAVRVCSFAL